MPHFILEYTDNIKTEAHIPDLVRKANAILMAQGGETGRSDLDRNARGPIRGGARRRSSH